MVLFLELAIGSTSLSVSQVCQVTQASWWFCAVYRAFSCFVSHTKQAAFWVDMTYFIYTVMSWGSSPGRTDIQLQSPLPLQAPTVAVVHSDILCCWGLLLARSQGQIILQSPGSFFFFLPQCIVTPKCILCPFDNSLVRV